MGAPWLKQLGHHGVCDVPPAPGGYQCLIAAGTGGHCCPCTRLVTPQLPMQGLGHSLPHDQPRDKAASRVGTCLSFHRTSPNFSLQSISASYSSPTYRQPWKPSRTWVSCSALKQEGCSAAWSWQGGTGDPEQGEAFLGQSPCAWATSTVSIQHQDKTQPATSGARVLPAPAKGSGIHAANAIGSTQYI